MFEPERLVPAAPDATLLSPEHAASSFGPLDPTLHEFLLATARAVAVRGAFRLKGAAALAGQHLSMPGWEDRFGDRRFPGLVLGSDGRGSELIVHPSSGRVISVHHDSLPELAAELGASTPEAFVDALYARAAPLHLRQVLRLHVELDALPDEPVVLLHAVAAALELPMAQTLDLLEQRGAELLWTRCRDALEQWDRKTLIQAHSLRLALEREPDVLQRKRTLDLSVAGLVELPPALATIRGLETLELGGNPCLALDSALALLASLPKLETLSLAACGLRELPVATAQLEALQVLELRANPLDAIDPASLPPNLARLDVRETGLVDESQLGAVRSQRPELHVLFFPETQPHGLAAALRDPAATRILDLSRGLYDADEFLTKLPPLARFPKLEVLRLDNQVELSASEVLRACAGLPLVELRIAALAGAQELDSRLLEPFEQLEILYLGDRYRLRELWPTLARLPALRELHAALGWDPPELTPSRLRVLHLGDVSSDGEPVPEGLAELSELEELSLSGYGDRIPAAVAKLSRLRVLELAFNPEQARERFAALGGLEVLRIRTGGTVVLPDLRAMPRLRELVIDRDSSPPYIEGAIDSLASPSALETLVLVGRPQGPLPDGLARLPLRRLRVEGHDSPTVVGTWLGGLSQLEALTLREVTLTDPKALARLTALRELDVVTVELGDDGAEALMSGPLLHRLRLHGSKLTAFPVGLSRQRALVELTISCGEGFDVLRNAEELRGLEALEHLELSCMFSGKHLPESIAALPRLRRLTLDSAWELDWDQVFTLIAKIPSLRELRACWAKIPKLPAAVAKATALEVINLHQAGLHAVDPAIAKLTRLRELQVTTNPIPSAAVKKLRKLLPWCRVHA